MANVHVVLSKMKKIFVLLFLFLILLILINSCPVITQWDRSLIVFVQQKLSHLLLVIPMLPDCIMYSIMIGIPLIGFGIFFIKKNLYADLICIFSVPLVTFLLNCVIKPIVKRPRPPMELQITSIHPDSFSFVSSHSLVTICLWGMVVWYLHKYCADKRLKLLGSIIAISWILFVGLSRIWIGVHNPTDVLGAYILGLLLISLYIPATKAVEKLLIEIMLKVVKKFT